MESTLVDTWTCQKGHKDNFRISYEKHRGKYVFRHHCRTCDKVWSKNANIKNNYRHQKLQRPQNIERKYTTVHEWLKRNFTKTFCDNCSHDGSTNRLEWANISGEYLKDRKDYKVLCKPCHWSYDNV